MSDKTFGIMKDLKIGKYVLIDDTPCKVVNIETSAPGKHGAAKMRVTGIGLFGGEKKTLLKPSDADVEIPIIERKNGQIVSVTDTSAQVMDAVTFETFEITIPEEMRAEAASGKEVEYMVTMGKVILTRIKS